MLPTNTASFKQHLHSKLSKRAKYLTLRPVHFVPGEPKGPKVKLPLPGSKTLREKKALSNICGAETVQLAIDINMSLGNYLVDADRNTFLDLATQFGTLPLGYNYPTLLDIFNDSSKLAVIVNRPTCGRFPPSMWLEKIEKVLLANAPPGLHHVTNMMCGSCSVENTLKIMFIDYESKKRGDADFDETEKRTALTNMSPGCPRSTVLSFMGATHGGTFGALAISHSDPMAKINIPTRRWPIAPLPKYKYPIEENLNENRMENNMCVGRVEELIQEFNAKGRPVVGVIMETIQTWENFEFMPEFIRNVQLTALRHGCHFTIDEVGTGLAASGKFWDHENLDFEFAPDSVVFGGKMQFGGYYVKKHNVKHAFRIFNTWMGEPGRLLVLEEIVKAVKKLKLMENAKVLGAELKESIVGLWKEHPGLIHHVTGRGFLLGVTFVNGEKRDEVFRNLFELGVLCISSGNATLQFKPALVFQKEHADIFLDAFRKALLKAK